MENYVDGGLLRKADEGDRSAITTMCELAVEHLQRLAAAAVCGSDDVTPWVIAALEAIGRGQEPNHAFRWNQSKRGRPKVGHEFRDWIVRREVREKLRQLNQDCPDGRHFSAACAAIASELGGEIHLSDKRIEQICKGLTVDTELPPPEDIFPIEQVLRKARRKPNRN